MQISEILVQTKFRKLGWKVIRNGAPDFIMEKGKRKMAVEVKTGDTKLTPEQKKYGKFLRSLGLEYRIIRVNKNEIKHFTKRFNRYSDIIEAMYDKISAKDKSLLIWLLMDIKTKIIKKETSALKNLPKNLNSTQTINRWLKRCRKIRITLTPEQCQILNKIKI